MNPGMIQLVHLLAYKTIPAFLTVLFLGVFVAASIRCFFGRVTFGRLLVLTLLSPPVLERLSALLYGLLAAFLQSRGQISGSVFSALSDAVKGALLAGIELIGLLLYLRYTKAQTRAFGAYVYCSVFALLMLNQNVSFFAAFVLIRYFRPGTALLFLIYLLEALLYYLTAILPLSEFSRDRQPRYARSFRLLPLVPLFSLVLLLVVKSVFASFFLSDREFSSLLESAERSTMRIFTQYFALKTTHRAFLSVFFLLFIALILILFSEKLIRILRGINALSLELEEVKEELACRETAAGIEQEGDPYFLYMPDMPEQSDEPDEPDERKDPDSPITY